MIIYISKEDVLSFLKSESLSETGICYFWENEDVYHLFIKPQMHSYGNSNSILFVREINDVNKYASSQYLFYIVARSIENELQVEVYKNIDNLLEKCNFDYIPTQSELYSRNKGLIELNILANKHVTVIGLGSFGSQISIELAKAGVGSFSLFDFDRVELHNLVRHSAYLKDLGRLKTDVLLDAIKGKNPYSSVNLFPFDITENTALLEEEIKHSDIVICATDNNKSRFYITDFLERYKKIGIFGGAITRAEGGHAFIQRPDQACYCCLVGNDFFVNAQEEISSLESARRNGQIADYVSPEDAQAMVQVGLSTDIEPLSNMIVKLVLVELSRGAESGISSLESEFVFNYYFWANRRDRTYSHWAPFPNCGNKPTIMRWYGTQIPKNSGCAICSSKIVLDEGQYLPGYSSSNTDMNDIVPDFESATIK